MTLGALTLPKFLCRRRTRGTKEISKDMRGMEFHQLIQTDQSVEALGLELQTLAKRGFPTLKGKDFDRLVKGRFFQALLPRWQRKLGAPKPDESFDELFNCACTTERREQQYCEVACSLRPWCVQ